MSIGRKLVLSIPTILVSALSDFIPWGLITAALTLALYGLMLFFPRKSLVKINANIAIEGLTHGDLGIARDHVEIALREAAASDSLSLPEIELLRQACDKTVSALAIAGQVDAANTLRKLSEMVVTGYADGEKA